MRAPKNAFVLMLLWSLPLLHGHPMCALNPLHAGVPLLQKHHLRVCPA
jgi:hypothetical protein